MRATVDLGRQDPNCTAHYHGTYGAFKTGGCRCPHAKEAHRITGKRFRQGRQPTPFVDGHGTARRLQALAAIGWNFTNLGTRLGCTSEATRQWANLTYPTVHRDTAKRVADLYRELAGIPGTSATTRRRALNNGWLTPIAWDANIDDPHAQPIGDDTEPGLPITYDPERVRRVVAGLVRGVDLRPAERTEAFRRLVALGAGYGHIQRQLGMSATTYRKMAAATSGEVAA